MLYHTRYNCKHANLVSAAIWFGKGLSGVCVCACVHVTFGAYEVHISLVMQCTFASVLLCTLSAPVNIKGSTRDVVCSPHCMAEQCIHAIVLLKLYVHSMPLTQFHLYVCRTHCLLVLTHLIFLACPWKT